MKKMLMVVSAGVVVFSAFAFNRVPKPKKGNNIYYAIGTSQVSFFWVTYRPDQDFYSCTYINAAGCTVTSPDPLDLPIFDNILPASANIWNGNGSAYQ